MTEPVEERRSRGSLRRRISFAIAVVLTGVIAVVFYHQSQLLPGRISKYVNNHYLKGTNFEFSVEGVSGFFIRHLTLKNPVLRYQSPSASYNVFRADEISVEYDLMPIFAFRLIVTDLTLRNVAIHLRQDAEGRLVLPVLPGGGKGRRMGVSPVVNVRRFLIDGLEMQFGGNKRELAVRDVNLTGSFEYADHAGRLTVDEGRAYLIDSKKTVSSVRLEARSDGESVRLDDFAVKLDQSFVIAHGEFREGRLRDVNLVFNPINLAELHELGLTPEAEGEFTGRVALAGPVDSLVVGGEISGSGFDVDLSAVKFEGLFTPDRLALSRLNGAVFGSKVDGAFDLAIATEDFKFDGTCEDLDLGRGFIKDTKVPSMSLTGNVSVDRTKEIDRYVWRGDLDRAVVDGFECFDVRAQGVWEKATGMSIDRVSLQRPGFKAEGSGTVSPANVADIVFKVDGNDLSYFWDHFKLPQIGGTVALNGRLRGPIDDFQVNLNGPFRDLTFDPMEVDSGTVVAEARRIGTLAPEVSVSLSGGRGGISGQWFDSPVVHVEVDSSRVEVRNAHFARGDTSFVADLDVKGKGKKARIDVRRVVVTTPADVWATTRPSAMYVEPGILRVDSLELTCARGAFGLAGVFHSDEKRMNMTVWGRGINLAVARDAARLPFDLRGTGDFTLVLDGPDDDPHARLDMDVAHGVIDSVTFDKLTAKAAFDGSAYTLDDLLVVAGRDSVRGRGSWKSDVSPRRIMRKERPESMWSAPLAADLRVTHFPLRTLFRAMHRPSLVAAAYNGTLSVGGTIDKPTAIVRGAIVPARGPGHELPPARLDVEYADGALRVADVSTTDVVALRLSGKFPLVLSLRQGARVDSDRPLEFRLDLAPTNEVSEIGRYFNKISLLRGVMSGTVVGSGTPGNPRLSGGLTLTRGDLRVVGLQEAFTDLAVRVDFIDDIVRLTSLSARSGKDGTFAATGWARISDYRPVDYKLDVNMKDFWLRTIPDMEVRADGNINVKLVPWRDQRRIPSIGGHLDIREASITMELTAGTGAGAEFTRPTDEPNWICSLDMDADKNVWIRNRDLTVEMEGDVILNRDERGLYFRGDMSILRGSYRLYGNKFQITDGVFNFSASETLRPSMQIDAYTPYKGKMNDQAENNIYMTLSWPYDKKEPTIKFSYDVPGYSEAEILAMLGGNNLGAGIAANTLQNAIDQSMSGFNVDIDQQSYKDPSKTGPSAKATQETSIGVGKYVWEDVYLQYRRGLSAEGEQEVNVEYRLGKRLLLRSQLIYNSRTANSQGIKGKGTDEYNLDLKYRFEF